MTVVGVLDRLPRIVGDLGDGVVDAFARTAHVHRVTHVGLVDEPAQKGGFDEVVGAYVERTHCELRAVYRAHCHDRCPCLRSNPSAEFDAAVTELVEAENHRVGHAELNCFERGSDGGHGPALDRVLRQRGPDVVEEVQVLVDDKDELRTDIT